MPFLSRQAAVKFVAKSASFHAQERGNLNMNFLKLRNWLQLRQDQKYSFWNLAQIVFLSHDFRDDVSSLQICYLCSQPPQPDICSPCQQLIFCMSCMHVIMLYCVGASSCVHMGCVYDTLSFLSAGKSAIELLLLLLKKKFRQDTIYAYTQSDKQSLVGRETAEWQVSEQCLKPMQAHHLSNPDKI